MGWASNVCSNDVTESSRNITVFNKPYLRRQDMSNSCFENIPFKMMNAKELISLVWFGGKSINF